MMKKIIFILALLLIMANIICYGQQSSKTYITITTTLHGKIPLSLNGNGEAIIDWGDGSALQTVTLYPLPPFRLDMYKDRDCTPHTFDSSNVKTITVTGDITGINTGETESVIAIDVSRMPSLQSLDCYRENLTELDVSNNTVLTHLYCGSNRLSSLDLSKNTMLKGLYCFNNQLTKLEVSNSSALTELRCFENLLPDLDVSKNVNLIKLDCNNNQLSNLDVRKNINLRELTCSYNLLENLDISQNTVLRCLHCYSNKIDNKALMEIFAALPYRPQNESLLIRAAANPDYENLTATDKAVATAKNWVVFEE